MKTLAIPFATLLLFASCNKEDMPIPASNSTARQSGDTITRVVRTLGEHDPLTNEIGPRRARTEGANPTLARITGDTLRLIKGIPSEHKPLTNETGPSKPKK